jgi:hypothetical protein
MSSSAWTPPTVRPPDRVQVWASQLAAGDFPPVCAMTGSPAETWRKFRFNSPPAWAVVFVFLICVGVGFFVSIPLSYAVSRRAGGRLPLTHRSNRLLELPKRAAIAILALSAGLWIITAVAETRPYDVANPWPQLIGLVVLSIALITLVFGVVLLEGALLVRFPFGPGAKVMMQMPGQPDRLVELVRVHPAFVAAVNERQAAPPPQSAGTN